jgi:hypothetical protein
MIIEGFFHRADVEKRRTADATSINEEMLDFSSRCAERIRRGVTYPDDVVTSASLN